MTKNHAKLQCIQHAKLIIQFVRPNKKIPVLR